MSDDLLKFKLDLLQVASCTCGTKTPEAKYHTDSCRYRLICEIQNDVDALRTQLAGLAQELATATQKLEEARKDAATAWTVCASIHREYAKGKDPLFTTRQQDFVNSENKARALAIEQGKEGDES